MNVRWPAAASAQNRVPKIVGDTAPNEPWMVATSDAALKARSVRGGAMTIGAQGLKFVLQTGSIVVMARLLTPEDFGVQGMVLAMTGFLGLFRDAGLSAVTVQRDEVNANQLSTLFWINVLLGALLVLSGVAAAPLLVAFYHDPRLYPVTVVSVLAFGISGLGFQHGALLQRNMRFAAITTIDVLSVVATLLTGIGLALAGFGYWALILSNVVGPLVGAVGAWIAMPWIPSLPKRNAGIAQMLRFGGTVTGNSVVVYLGYNTEKILLGRFWGADALGLYGRAYQLINLPVQQLHAALYDVVFPTLSRMQHDRERLCRTFLKVYLSSSPLSSRSLSAAPCLRRRLPRSFLARDGLLRLLYSDCSCRWR